MANEWLIADGKACYDTGVAGFHLSQEEQFILGLFYTIEFTLSGVTQGVMRLESLEGKPEFAVDGTYSVSGKAIQTNFDVSGQEDGFGDVFDGCITDISVRWTPLYRIETAASVVVYEQTGNDAVQSAGNILLYAVDWSELPLGTYRIKFTDGPLIYQSHCLCVVNDPCSILISWTNLENAGGFNYSDLNFTQNLRVQGRLGEDFGKSIQRDVFRFSDGSKKLLYAERDQEKVLTVKEMPAYLHRALMLGIDYDRFYVNSLEYLVDEQDYTPAWRKSSQLAPVELNVTPKNEGFINQNCSTS